MSAQDQLLVVRCQLGEPGAQRALVERWYVELRSYARALNQDEAAADDACQDAWIDALRGLPKLRDPSSFRAWLFRVARRRLVDGQRSGAREARKRSSLGHAALPVESAVDFEQLDLERGLAQLQPNEREVLLLVHARGLTYAEAAEVLGVPLGTIRSRLHRARTQLHTHMQRQHT